MTPADPSIDKFNPIYRLAFESMNQGFCLLEKVYTQAGTPPDFRYLLTNQAFTHHSGLEQVMGRTLQQVVPNVENHILAYYDAVALGGQPIHTESHVASLDRWIEVYAFRIEAQDPIQIGVLFTDISNRKKNEKALRESEERQRLLIAASSESVYQMSPDWQHMERLTGKESLVDTHTVNQSWIEQYIPAQDQASVWAVVQAAINTKSLFELEHRVVQLDGRLGWIFSRAIPVLDEQGAIQTWFGAASNITARKQAEEDLELANQRKDEFLALLAHELRNPLATVRSGLAILSVTDEPDTMASQTIILLNRQVDHLVHMVDDLLDVSRINQGKIQLKRERLDLNVLLTSALAAIHPQFEARQKRVHLLTWPTSLFMMGDETRLNQIVINLLTNGLRYTGPQGQVWVSVKAEDNQAILRVRDNGIGLSEAQRLTIFDLFVQADTSLARQQGGLGVGLTLARRLVELHGGRIEAHSPGLGQGSEFVVYLPLLKALEPIVDLGHTQGSVPSVGHQLVLIDDNVDALLMLSMLLKIKGYSVTTAVGGLEGIQAAQALKPSVILCDISMPGMDGYETCRQIRQHTWGESVILVALTGYGQADDVQRSLEAGFNKHLVKPVDIKELSELLDGLPVPR